MTTILDEKIGIGTDTPRFQIDIVESEDYGAKGFLTCTSTSTSAYANWGTSNGTGGGVFGMAGVNYNVIPVLQNRGFAYSYDSAGFVVGTGDATPVIFAINKTEVGRFNEAGGGLVLGATSIADSARKNGEIWCDGTVFKKKVGGVVSTLT